MKETRRIHDVNLRIKSTLAFITLEIVITRAAPAFYKLFMVMGCVFDINTVHKTVEKINVSGILLKFTFM